jgi:hypothetical protein
VRFSDHFIAVLAYFPFIVAVPAAVAVICNHIDAAKRHPEVVYTSYGLLALGIAYLLSRPSGTTFKGVDCGVAGVLAALCFLVVYLRATDILTKRALALLWRELFLVGFAGLNFYLAWGDWKDWGYNMMAVLCAASAVLLWRSSPLAKYPLYAVTLLLAGSALVGGIYNYAHEPALRQSTIKFQIISWLTPAIPSALLINCCLYARRVARGERKMVTADNDHS